ncbi:MAG: xanthine dehydrogenase family protein molybdopterin-binding subunit [Rhodospirillaceae bacterium]
MNENVFPMVVSEIAPASRRDVLKGGLAGLIIAFTWSSRGSARAAEAPARKPVDPNAFVRIAPDNTVTVIVKHLEMGQGVYTGLPTIVAEELDADWSQMRAESAPANAALYANLAFGTIQGTGGSTAVANSFDQLRQAGAMARAMLVQAAAQTWKVPAADITVSKGVVAHAASEKTATFGQLAAAAAKLKPPTEVKLKDIKDFTLIGTELPRLDNIEKTTGAAIYGLDIVRPGMVYAAVLHPPRFGATVKTVDHAAAFRMKGVQTVLTIPSGVAVVADSFWTARKARDSLQVTWDETKAEKRGSAQLLAEYKALAAKPGESARHDGDATAVLAKAKQTIHAEFEFPYLAHAPMEPLDCVVEASEAGCDIWVGSQFQTIDQANAAKVLGLKPEQVNIHTLLAGGSFGRRANLGSDYIVECAQIAKGLPKGTPVKMIWTREDDMRSGLYRPMYYHTLKAGLDEKGNLVAWAHRIVGQSITKGTPFAGPGIDATTIEGAKNLPYTVANIDVDVHTTDVGVPVLWWRSVGSTHNAYSTEVFLDMVAKAAGKDPLAFRLALVGDNLRHKGVLELAARKAGWSSPLPAGRARGIAVAEAFGSFVAQVAEISRGADGRIRVDRIVCAVDCGIAVNPDVIRAQMEGGIGYGLSAILKGAITLKDGVVEQGNFDSYDVLRMDEMPKVEVYIVPSTLPPTGVGEPGVPSAGPAVANAVFALTGKPVTKLPMRPQISS